jgi:hypothetical protein
MSALGSREHRYWPSRGGWIGPPLWGDSMSLRCARDSLRCVAPRTKPMPLRQVPPPPELLKTEAREILDIDVEKHLKRLETGEGEPWPPRESSD